MISPSASAPIRGDAAAFLDPDQGAPRVPLCNIPVERFSRTQYCVAGRRVKSQERQERLRAALKENLKRRKAQARGREGRRGDGPTASPPADDNENETPER
jgi:hypothetical protein